MSAAAGEVDWIEDPAGFDRLAAEWNALAEGEPPFVRHEWFRAWWSSFGAGRRLSVCTVRRRGELVGAMPFSRQGGTLSVLANGHSPLLRPLAADRDALGELAGAVVDARPETLSISHLGVEDPFVELVAGCSRRAGRVTWVEPGQVSPAVELAGGPDEFRRGLERETRKELDRVRRKLASENEASFAPLAEPTDLERELDRGFEVEASGWKGRRGTAVQADERTDRFYRTVAHAFDALGAVRLSTISVGDRPIAWDFCLVWGSRLWIPKGGYDESYRRYAPGLLLTLAQIEEASRLGLASVELLGDADAYKLKFANALRPQCAVHSYRRLPRPLLDYAYRRGARPLLRSAYRKARAHRAGSR